MPIIGIIKMIISSIGFVLSLATSLYTRKSILQLRNMLIANNTVNGLSLKPILYKDNIEIITIKLYKRDRHLCLPGDKLYTIRSHISIDDQYISYKPIYHIADNHIYVHKRECGLINDEPYDYIDMNITRYKTPISVYSLHDKKDKIIGVSSDKDLLTEFAVKNTHYIWYMLTLICAIICIIEIFI